MTSINSPIEELPKITKPLIAALKKLGISKVRDLLLYLPYKHLDFSRLMDIRDVKPNESITIQGTIKSIQGRFSFRSRLSLAEAVVSDNTGSIKILWFNQGYLAKTLQKGEQVFLSGTPEYYKSTLQLVNPIYEKASDFPVHTSRLVPVYHLSQKIYPKTFRNLVAAALLQAEQLEEILPAEVLKRQRLPAIFQAIKQAHFPKTPDQLKQARTRLAFEEIFTNQLAAQKYKMELAKKAAIPLPFNRDLIKAFVDSLPFQLTAGQKKAAWDILQDMEKPTPMNRLLEADVGSGKTLVALIAAVQAVFHGKQAVFLAPTEILARQHFETAKKFLKNIKISLLTGHFSQIGGKQTPKAKHYALINQGMPGVFVGTHALLSEKIRFKELALVIIDEQHRFGVEQRSALIHTNSKIPHLLSLSATPIPRTLQMAFYGELDISQIKFKPAGRKPILTRLVTKDRRPKAYEFIKRELESGRQAFIITPLIEESDKLGVKAAATEAENLKKVFPEFRIGLMHGRLKGEEKERVMADFLANRFHILVSTSVVEVGVDVPNASVMVIEGAERFGLAQLHQFRGRVGRAEHQSYCLLFSETANQESLRRLGEFAKINDGFALAELDLELRGFGDLYGSQQSGWNFKYFSPAYVALIEPARQEARLLLQDDPDLKNHVLLKEKIADKVIHFE